MRSLWVVVGLLACDDGGAGVDDSTVAFDGRPGPDTGGLDATRVGDGAPSDAEASEAGRMDAGRMDAGRDAGRDAGAPDAGGLDAGPQPPVSTWESRAAVVGGAIQEIAVVARGGEVWVLGGFDGQTRIVPRVGVYTPATDSWREGPPLPVPMHHANAAVIDERIYVLGFLGRGFASDGRGYMLAPGSQQWEQVASMPAGRERGAAGTVALGRHIYIVGGLSLGRVYGMVDRYDVDADTWAVVPELPTLRDHMAAGAVDGRIVVAGGRVGDIESQVDRVDVFDPAESAWRAGAPMPTARGGTAGAVLDGWLYVIGGEGNRAVASGVFPTVEAYHPASDRWVTLPDMPNPRHGFGAVAVDGRIYVPGGADVQAFGAVDTVEVLVP